MIKVKLVTADYKSLYMAHSFVIRYRIRKVHAATRAIKTRGGIVRCNEAVLGNRGGCW